MLHCLHHIESLEQSSRSEANARGWIARIRPIRRIRTARLIIKIISLQPIASRLYVIISIFSLSSNLTHLFMLVIIVKYRLIIALPPTPTNHIRPICQKQHVWFRVSTSRGLARSGTTGRLPPAIENTA